MGEDDKTGVRNFLNSSKIFMNSSKIFLNSTRIKQKIHQSKLTNNSNEIYYYNGDNEDDDNKIIGHKTKFIVPVPN